MRLTLLVLLTYLTLGFAQAGTAPTELRLEDGTEIPLRVYPAHGDALLLWLACDEGHGTREARTAAKLAEKGIEVWLPDYLGGHFLPVAPSSMAQISGDEVAALIDLAQENTGKRFFMISAGRGALPTLLGVHTWQERHPDRPAPLGVILFYPELYADTPEAGAEVQYHEVVGKTHVPIFVYQGERSPGRWWLGHLRDALSAGGSPVESEILPKVRGYFYVRQDPSPPEEALAQRLPELIRKAMTSIESLPGAKK
ncbi:MAG: hypothetical protein KGZ83_22065 [Sulfuricella sp.]|nr:hypothetical protein [Sulfuricella sp.]